MSEFEFDLNIPKLHDLLPNRPTTWHVATNDRDDREDREDWEESQDAKSQKTNDKTMKSLLSGELSGDENPYDDLYYLGD